MARRYLRRRRGGAGSQGFYEELDSDYEENGHVQLVDRNSRRKKSWSEF